MFEIKQIIVRLRMGESVRQVARSQRVGRDTVTSIRARALERGWLDPIVDLPDEATLALALKLAAVTPRQVSSVEPFRDEILKWHGQGINATTIRRALHEQHGYNGSVDALYRFLKREIRDTPPATIKLEFPVAEMAQIDFGMGPLIAFKSRRVLGQFFRDDSANPWRSA